MLNLLPLKRVSLSDPGPVDRSTWPFSLAPVQTLLDDGFELSSLTLIAGENGAGKSVLLESIAEAYGFPLDGGSR